MIPRISVMIPNFNRNMFLLKTINSVLNQTINLDYLEIFVIDDCSDKEDPFDVIGCFYPRVQIIRNHKNIGQVNNLNKCIEYANCDLIHILHSDDLVTPTFYERVIESFENDNVSVVFSSSFYVDTTDKIIGKNELLSSNDGFLNCINKRLSVEQIIQTPSIVVKSFIYKEIGFFRNDFFMVEDWEMWFRISTKYDFWYISDYLSYYRINDSFSTSNTNFYNGNFLHDLKMLQSEFLKFHGDYSLFSESIIKYSNLFIGNAKSINGFSNNITHFLYMPSFILKLKYILQKFKSYFFSYA